MDTPSYVKRFVNYCGKLSNSIFSFTNDEKKSCTCGSINKKPLAKLREPAGKDFRIVREATIVTFDPNSKFTLWPGYVSGTGQTYFEQAFYDVKEVGYGSFGIVYAATFRGDGKRYAVKKAHYAYLGLKNRTRLLHEVDVHERFANSPGILRFYGAWEEEDRLYIQLELCKFSLSDIKQCPACVNCKTLTVFARDLLTGLEQLHAKDVLHFDVKPDNILVTEDLHCKLGDFGVAVRLKVDELYDLDEGDSRYLALEVLNNPPTKASDIYSLGMSLLELAAKVNLPPSGTGFQMIRQGYINPNWLNSIEDVRLRALILWMIDPDPLKRPTATMALAALSDKPDSPFNSDKLVLYFIILTALVISGIILLP